MKHIIILLTMLLLIACQQSSEIKGSDNEEIITNTMENIQLNNIAILTNEINNNENIDIDILTDEENNIEDFDNAILTNEIINSNTDFDLEKKVLARENLFKYMQITCFTNMNDLMDYNDVTMLSEQQKKDYAGHICNVTSSRLVHREFQQQIYDYMQKTKLFDYLSDRNKGDFVELTARAIMYDYSNFDKIDEAFPIMDSIAYLLTKTDTDFDIPSYYRNYGYLYFQKGDYENAKKEYLKSADVYKKNNDMEAYYSSLRCYYSSCDKRNAEEYKKSMLEFLSIVPKHLPSYEIAVNDLKTFITVKEIDKEIEKLIKKDPSITNNFEKLEKEIRQIQKQNEEYYENQTKELINKI